MKEVIRCSKCGDYPHYVSYLSKKMFSEDDKIKILRGLDWVITDYEILCPVCAYKTRG